MSKSEPKPKIIYKNLEDVLKQSSLHKNISASKGSFKKSPLHQMVRTLKNEPNKSSLVCKQNRVSCSSSGRVDPGKQKQDVGSFPAYYNQIDAAFTDLQDFLCQSKEQVVNKLRICFDSEHKDGLNQAREKVEDLRKMSQYIKHIAKFFIAGEVPDLHSPRAAAKTVHTELPDEGQERISALSMKNSKSRVHRRGEFMGDRKKTIYELILQERESKGKGNSQAWRKIL